MELIKVENGIVSASEMLEQEALEIKRLEELLKAKKDNLTLTLLDEMQKHDIKKIETPDVIISYIDETEVEYFDKAKFKEDYPDLYDDYITFKKKKSYIAIRTK